MHCHKIRESSVCNEMCAREQIDTQKREFVIEFVEPFFLLELSDYVTIVITVPETHAAVVREAMERAGAGKIGCLSSSIMINGQFNSLFLLSWHFGTKLAHRLPIYASKSNHLPIEILNCVVLCY